MCDLCKVSLEKLAQLANDPVKESEEGASELVRDVCTKKQGGATLLGWGLLSQNSRAEKA